MLDQLEQVGVLFFSIWAEIVYCFKFSNMQIMTAFELLIAQVVLVQLCTKKSRKRYVFMVTDFELSISLQWQGFHCTVKGCSTMKWQSYSVLPIGIAHCKLVVTGWYWLMFSPVIFRDERTGFLQSVEHGKGQSKTGWKKISNSRWALDDSRNHLCRHESNSQS